VNAQLEAQLLSAFRWLSEERQMRVITELAFEAIAVKDAMPPTRPPAPGPSLRLVVDNDNTRVRP